MAAIDVLLNWSPTSERMHQVVLAGLLRHTRLLEMLGIPGVPTDLETETQGRLYDFSVSLDTGRKALVELKIDAALDESQIRRQMAAVPNGDLMVYVLLGTTRFSWNCLKLEEIRQALERAPDTQSVKFIDLPTMREAVAALVSHATEPDHRDLAVAYGSLLRRIHESTRQFAGKPLTEWTSLDWYGLFSRLVAEFQLTDAGMNYVANPRGGFIGCWWDFQSIPSFPNAEAYLQLEESLLCFKVAVEAENDQPGVRQTFSDAVLNASRLFGFDAKKPVRFGRGTYMTVAVLDGDYRCGPSGNTLDWERIRAIIPAARDVLAAALSSLGPES